MEQRLGGATDLGAAIRAARARLGVSQSALAERVGVSRMTISRLERGDQVSVQTAFDAARVCGLCLAAGETRGWLTAQEYGQAIAKELNTGDPYFALRLLRQAVEDLDYLAERDESPAVQQFLAHAPATGDPRWDALLILAVAQGCRRHHIPSPPWCAVQPLAEPFFPSQPSRRFIERTIERTPGAFARANVWIDANDMTYA